MEALDPPDDGAVALVDVRRGVILASSLAHGEAEMSSALSSAAACVAEITTRPVFDDGESSSDEAFLIGGRFVHVVVRAPAREGIAVVGVARRSANLGLLLVHARRIAAEVTS